MHGLPSHHTRGRHSPVSVCDRVVIQLIPPFFFRLLSSNHFPVHPSSSHHAFLFLLAVGCSQCFGSLCLAREGDVSNARARAMLHTSYPRLATAHALRGTMASVSSLSAITGTVPAALPASSVVPALSITCRTVHGAGEGKGRRVEALGGGGAGVYEPRPLPSTLRRRVSATPDPAARTSRAETQPRHDGSSLPQGAEHSPSSSSSPNETRADARFARPLPDVPYGLPEDHLFEAERMGRFQKDWLSTIVPTWRDRVAQTRYLPNKDDWWASPPHEALFELAARGQPYHDTLRTIMEHSYFFLFEAVMLAKDAPLPHVMYEDFMKCLTFSSLQNVPEEQFALSTQLVKHLLCMAACTCTVDTYYFASAEQMFRRIEQQQPQMGSELLSAWVYVCTAAGRLSVALDYAEYMARCGLRFDPEVFALMMHPSVNVLHILQGNVPSVAKGLVVQQRLCARLQAGAPVTTTTAITTHTQSRQDMTTASIALHAMFVYHVLTLQHAKKWELVRLATQPARVVPMLPRTRQLAVSLFASEKGVRCGPRSTKALVAQLVMADDVDQAPSAAAAAVLYVLLRTRMNETLPAFAELPRTAFVDTFDYADRGGEARPERSEAQRHAHDDDATFVLQHIHRIVRRGGTGHAARSARVGDLSDHNTHRAEVSESSTEEDEDDAARVWHVAAPMIQALLRQDGEGAEMVSRGDDVVSTRAQTPVQQDVPMMPSLQGPKGVMRALAKCADPRSPWSLAVLPAQELRRRVAELDALAAPHQPTHARGTKHAASLEALVALSERAASAATRRAEALRTDGASHDAMASVDGHDAASELQQEAESWRDLAALVHAAKGETASAASVAPPHAIHTGVISDDAVQASNEYYAAMNAAEQEREQFVATFAAQAWIDPSSGKGFSA